MKNTTIPVITKGKKTRSKSEQVKQKWFVEFWIDGVRKRLSNGLNRIKDYDEKLREFNKYRDEVERSLVEGYGGDVKQDSKNVYPLPQIFSKTQFSETPLSNKTPHNTKPLVKVAVDEYLQYHIDKGSRQNTINTYKAKLTYLADEYGELNIDLIQHRHIDTLMLRLSNLKRWSPKTYNNCRLFYVGFFHWAISYGYCEINPVQKVKNKRVPKSKKHRPFEDEDFRLIMNEVKKNKLLNVFVQSIFFTCCRPFELTQLKVKHIDFKKHTLFIPADISKNKKDGIVYLEPSYYQMLVELYSDAPKEAFLFTRAESIYGNTQGKTYKYYRELMLIIQSLGLSNKNYTLYSVKHYSNIQRFKQGWSLGEIMKGNRHSSIEQTETYLRELVNHIDISTKTLSLL